MTTRLDRPPPAPTAANDDQLRAPPAPFPVWLLLLVSVATFGFGVVIWLYRLLRRLEPEERRLKHIAWTLGASIPGFSLVVFAELQRLVRARFASTNAPWPHSNRSLLIMAAATALVVFSRLRFVDSLYLLLPLFFVVLQDRINAAHLLRGRSSATRALWLVPSSVGACAACWAMWQLEGGSLQLALAQEPEGELCEENGAFCVKPPRGWVQATAGTLSEGTILEMARPDRRAFIVVHRHDAEELSLDDVVDQRMNTIEEEFPIRTREEDRSSEVGAYVASMATYAAGSAQAPQSFWIKTIETADFVYEVVAASGAPEADRLDVYEALASVTAEGPSSP